MCVCKFDILTVEQWNSANSETVSGRLQSATDEDHLPRKTIETISSKIKSKIDQTSCHATIAGHSGSAIVLWQLKISAAESIKQAPTQLKLQWTADSEQPNRSHLLFQKWANCCSMFHVRPFDQNLFHRAMQHPRRPKTFHNIEVASILMKASESQSFIKACLVHLQVELPWCQPASLNLVCCACWLSLFAEQNHTWSQEVTATRGSWENS